MIVKNSVMAKIKSIYKGIVGTEDAEPVIQIPVGLPCLERGRLVKKGNFIFYHHYLPTIHHRW